MRRAILLAAFGASNPFGRSGLAKFESLCRSRFPAWPVRWAYTSPLLRERLARQKQKSDSVAKALWRLHYEKYDSIAIQPLQAIPGREYQDVCNNADAARSECGIACAVGKPLLAANLSDVASALLAHIPAQRNTDEDVIFMGHGARHPAEAIYSGLADSLAKADPRVFVGTMSGELVLENIMSRLTAEVVWLMPLLANIGQHALRDMAGPAETSWQSKLENAGHNCRPVLTGMIESSGLAAIWLSHLEEAINRLEGGSPEARKDSPGCDQQYGRESGCRKFLAEEDYGQDHAEND